MRKKFLEKRMIRLKAKKETLTARALASEDASEVRSINEDLAELNEEIAETVRNAKSLGVLEKDISFGNEGTVYTNVNSALKKSGINITSSNYIGGLGGKNISPQEIEEIFEELKQKKTVVRFLGIEVR